MSVLEVKEICLHLFIIHALNGMWGVPVVIPQGSGWWRVGCLCWLSWGGISSVLLFVGTPQELTLWTFIFWFIALLGMVSAASAIEAFHYLGFQFLWSKCIYLCFICSLWVLCFCLPTKVFLDIGFVCYLPGCAVRKKGVGFEGFGNLSYFCQGLIDSCFSCIGVE